jgi:phospholipid/cholesterol/gamma-HCH transport system permease protein
MNGMAGIVARVDGWIQDTAIGVYQYFTLAGRASRFIVARPFYWRDSLRQMDRMGVGTLPILLLTGLFTGMVLALQSSVALRRFGADMYVGSLVGVSMVRELGPVLAALIFAGRVGSGVAAELGSMRVTEQIDALQSFGTDPIKKLVTPRILAGVIMLPILTIVTTAVGILGGLVVSVYAVQISADVYLSGVWGTLAQSGFILGVFPRDFVVGLTKPLVFGGIIALTGCHYGLAARGGTEGVGLATTRAVVTASILILIVNYFVTQLLMVLVPARP